MHENTLNQTLAQMNQIEQQIYSIEAANINQETLKAMQNAGAAMKQIHGGLTIDKVDATMDTLREQHALGEEIANAITNAPIGDPIDEADLEDELENLEQEALDVQMMTGTVPVGELDKLPAVSSGPSKSHTAFRILAKCKIKYANLPSFVVRGKPQQEEESEEEELRKLQAEMAM